MGTFVYWFIVQVADIGHSPPDLHVFCFIFVCSLGLSASILIPGLPQNDEKVLSTFCHMVRDLYLVLFFKCINSTKHLLAGLRLYLPAERNLAGIRNRFCYQEGFYTNEVNLS